MRESLSTLGRVSVGGGRARLTLQDAWLARTEGLPGHSNAPAESVRLETCRNLAVAQLDAGAGDLDLTARLWHQRRREVYDDRAAELGTGTQWQETAFDSVGALAHLGWALGPHVVPAVTVSARLDRAGMDDLLLDDRDTTRIRASGTGALSADVYAWGDRLRLTPVAQAVALDNRRLGDNPTSNSPLPQESRQVDWAFTPRMGARLRPWPLLAVRASAGRFLRPPTLGELFGDRGAQVGNAALLPETGWQWDVGGGVRLPDHPAVSLALDVTHFWLASQDRIVLIQNSQRTSVPVNFGRTWTQGLEVALDLALLGVLDSQTAVTGTLSRNLEARADVANKQLPRVPARQITQATSAHWEDRVRLGHTWTYTSGNFWDATNWFETPPRSLHGAFLRATPAPALGFSLEASVLNLFDRTTEVVDRNPLDPADTARALQPLTDFIGYPLAGRTWLFSVRWAG